MTDSQIKTACRAVLGELFQIPQNYHAAGPLWGLKVACDALGRIAEKLERAAGAPSIHVPTEHAAATAGETRAEANQGHWHLRCGHPLLFMVGTSGDLHAKAGTCTVTLVGADWTPLTEQLRDMLAIYGAYRLSYEQHQWSANVRADNAEDILCQVRGALMTALRLHGVDHRRGASDADVRALAEAYAKSIAQRAAAGPHRGPYPPSVAEQIYNNSGDLKDK